MAVSSIPQCFPPTTSRSTTASQSFSTPLSWCLPALQPLLCTRSTAHRKYQLYTNLQEKYLYLLPWLVSHLFSVLLELFIFFHLLCKVRQVGDDGRYIMKRWKTLISNWVFPLNIECVECTQYSSFRVIESELNDYKECNAMQHCPIFWLSCHRIQDV